MDDAKTVWCGNLADQVTEELLYELFLQVAPLERVAIPTDREGRKSNYGFITFKHELSVPFAVKLLNGIKMFDKGLNVKPRNGGTQQDKQSAQQNMVQRSFSYPNDAYNQMRPAQHTRFTEAADVNQQYVSYENLMQLGQLMNANYEFQDNNYAQHYGSPHGHSSGNSHGNSSRQQWDRNSYRDNRDKDRDRKEYDRSRHDYDRDRDRRDDYSNRNHNKRNNDRNNQNFDRHGGRRQHRHF